MRRPGHDLRRAIARTVPGVAAATLTLAAACAPDPFTPDPTSPDPAARTAAFEAYGRALDDRRLREDEYRQLVAGLEASDELVRLMAIGVLERATGTTMGYRFFDPPAERSAAVRRWRDALERGELVDGTARAGAVGPESTP